MLVDAIRMGASDLHFEPYEKTFRVRFRVDGVMQKMASPPVQLARQNRSPLKGHVTNGHLRAACATRWTYQT